jgi:hypothetical protein
LKNDELEHYFANFDANNPEFNKIYKWVYHSLLNGVFKSKGAGWIPYRTGIRKILDRIKSHKNLSFPVNELFDVYSRHPIVFTTNYEANTLSRLDTSFLYYLMYDKSQTMRQNDVDHIHCKSLLEGLGVDSQKINNIINYQLLDYGTNRGEKNGKSLGDWIDKFVDNKPLYLSRHLIPVDPLLWKEENFEKFFDARAALIIQKIKHYENG